MSVSIEAVSAERDVVDQAARADERFVFLVLAAVISLEGYGLLWLFG